MTEMFDIRLATLKDCASVADMSNNLHVELDYDNPPHSPHSIEQMMFGPRPLIESLIAFHGEHPAGQAIFQPFYNPDHSVPGLWMTELYVAPDFRSAKVGKQLMVALAKLALDRNYVSIWWSVLQSNEAACRFYQRLGARNSGAVQYEIDGEILTALARGDGPELPVNVAP
tara:strand:+ start:266217 stop:266729 length:513 start_codon:yes stop_codon:yes gene_type:complete